MPFDATQGNQANVVIKIAFLNYSDSESRQWGSGIGSQHCQRRCEEGGVGGTGSPVARIRSMDMKGRKETVKRIISPSQNLIILCHRFCMSPIR